MTEEALRDCQKQMARKLGCSVEFEMIGREGYLYIDRKLEAVMVWAEIDRFFRFVALGIKLHENAMNRRQRELDGLDATDS